MAGEEGIDPAAGPEASRKFRNALGQFATGVTVITTVTPTGEDVGMTVNSFSSLSLDPPLILWSLAKTASGYVYFQVGDPFAVNVIAVDQEAWARQLARSSGDKFVGVDYHRGLDRVPLLAGCVAYLECVTEARYPGGDHEIIVGRVRRLFNIGHPPLLFHRGIFHVLGNPSADAR
ncbi:MAG: flavin reductase [Rhodospirillaceae bacterium]|nr:MAG: flavin reductase [Rhodospirillaceae bacterium]